MTKFSFGVEIPFHYCLAAGDQSHYGPVVTVNNARQFPLHSGLIELQMTHRWFVV